MGWTAPVVLRGLRGKVDEDQIISRPFVNVDTDVLPLLEDIFAIFPELLELDYCFQL